MPQFAKVHSTAHEPIKKASEGSECSERVTKVAITECLVVSRDAAVAIIRPMAEVRVSLACELIASFSKPPRDRPAESLLPDNAAGDRIAHPT